MFEDFRFRFAALLLTLATWSCKGASTDIDANPNAGPTHLSTSIRGVTQPFAAVEGRIGEQVFTAQAGEDGDYTLEIRDAEADAVLVLWARAEGPIEWVSVIDTLSEVGALAGADGVLDGDESPRVRIDGVSTVRSAATSARAGRLPATASELAEGELTFNEALLAHTLLEGAVALELVAQGRAELPDGASTTWDLAQDPVGLRALARHLEPERAPSGMLTTEVASFLASRVFTSFEPRAEYLSQFRIRRGDRVGGDGARLHFDLGGTGRFQPAATNSEPASKAFAWAADGDGVVVTYDPPVAGASSLSKAEILALLEPSVADQAEGVLPDRTAIVHRTLVETNYRGLDQGHGVDWLAKWDVVEWGVDEVLGPLGVDTEPVRERQPWTAVLLYSPEVVPALPLSRDAVIGVWAMDVASTFDLDAIFGAWTAGAPSFGGGLLALDEGGHGVVTTGVSAQQTQVEWAVDDNGGLDITYPDGRVQQTQLVLDTGVEQGFLHRLSGAEASTYRRAMRVDTGFALTAEMITTPPGMYWQSTINDRAWEASATETPFEWVGGFGLAATGEVREIFTSVDGTLENYTGLNVWRIEDGTVLVDFEYGTTSGAGPCVEEDEACVVVRRRRWAPVALVDGNLWVLESYTYLRDWLTFVGGQATWDAARQEWRDASGVSIDITDDTYFIAPRLNVYHLESIPEQ